MKFLDTSGLTKLVNNIDDRLKNLVFYPGETIVTSQPENFVVCGYLSSTGSRITFSLPLPKNAYRAKTCVLTSLKVNVWHPGNGYLLATAFTLGGLQVFDNPAFTLNSWLVKPENYVAVEIQKATSNFREDPEYSSGSVQFNTPVTIRIHEYGISLTY